MKKYSNFSYRKAFGILEKLSKSHLKYFSSVKFTILALVIALCFLPKISNLGYLENLKQGIKGLFINIFARTLDIWDKSHINLDLISKKNYNEREYKEMREKIANLMIYNKILAAENAQAKILLNFMQRINFSFVSARLTWQSSGNFGRNYAVELVKNRGIALGGAVLNEKGLFGRITEITNIYAKITPITEANIKIPALFVNNNNEALLVGGGEVKAPYLLKIEYFEDMTGLEDGEEVVTAGEIAGIPRGIPIGKVRRMANEACADYLSENKNSERNLMDDENKKENTAAGDNSGDSANSEGDDVSIQKKKKNSKKNRCVYVQPNVDFSEIGLVSIAVANFS
jgi:rod shape-determining protein MreC